MDVQTTQTEPWLRELADVLGMGSPRQTPPSWDDADEIQTAAQFHEAGTSTRAQLVRYLLAHPEDERIQFVDASELDPSYRQQLVLEEAEFYREAVAGDLANEMRLRSGPGFDEAGEREKLLQVLEAEVTVFQVQLESEVVGFLSCVHVPVPNDPRPFRSTSFHEVDPVDSHLEFLPVPGIG